MKVVQENSVTLKNEATETTTRRNVAILEAYDHFIVVNVDEVSGWLETKYVSKSRMFDDMAIATKWFDKLCKDVNL